MLRKHFEGFQANRPEINTLAKVGWRWSDLPIGLKSSSRRMGMWARADVPIRFAKERGRGGLSAFLAQPSRLTRSLDLLTWLVHSRANVFTRPRRERECGCAKEKYVSSHARAVDDGWHEDDEMTGENQTGWLPPDPGCCHGSVRYAQPPPKQLTMTDRNQPLAL
ncbi:hypothetical protein PG985_003107 [Apiospora marii]|uniref:uncharacterized protein n=1 Tax=Apiospora marii TaxID=335849 RepID=UPI0031307F3C